MNGIINEVNGKNQVFLDCFRDKEIEEVYENERILH